MNKKRFICEQQGVDAYVCPLCDVTIVDAESVLCASMQQLEEVEGEYEW